MSKIEVTIKDILDKRIDKEKKTHHMGRRRKPAYVPIYNKIDRGEIPFRVTMKVRSTAWNLYCALRNYINYHKDRLPYVKVTFESDKKGKYFLEIFEKSREERRI